MTDRLVDMETLAAIAATGSMAAAGHRLGVSPAVVSRRLARLEKRLGARLVQRTTRSLALTEAGAAFRAHCARILAEIDDAETEVTRGSATASGTLRITSTVAFGRRLAPLLQRFQAMHPALRIQLHTSDALLHLVDDGFDLAVRFGALPDSSLIARRLAPNRRVICASPAYLSRHGRPRTPADLAAHDCICTGYPPTSEWRFADGTVVPVAGALASSDGETAHLWALQGAGLVQKSIWDVHEDLAAGRLETVLAAHPLPAVAIHAVYPHRRHSPARLRLCVAYLETELSRAARGLGLTA